MATADDLKKITARAAAVAGLPTPDEARQLAMETAQEVARLPGVEAVFSPESLALVRGVAASAQALLQSSDFKKFAAAAKESPAALAAEISQKAQSFALSSLNASVAAQGSGAKTEAEKDAAKAASAAAGLATAIYSAVLSYGQGVAANNDAVMAARLEAAADEADECYGGRALLRFLNPRGTGPDGAIVPADLFAFQSFPEYEGACGMGNKKKPPLYRPALGAGLIYLLESGLDNGATSTSTYADPPDVATFQKAHPGNTVNGSAGVVPGTTIPAKYYDLWLSKIRSLIGGGVGVPLERRLMFRALRLAIQSQYKVSGSNGGATLWPVYMDLLTDTFKRGYLPNNPNALDVMFFNRVFTPDSKKPAVKTVGILTELVKVSDPGSGQGWKNVEKSRWDLWRHPYPVSTMIYDMARKWDATINPSYAVDQAERKARATLFVALSRVAALKAGGATSIAPSMLQGIPPEVQKQLGVKIRPGIYSPEQQRRVDELRAQGLTLKQINEQLAREMKKPTSPVVGAIVFLGVGMGLGRILFWRKKTGARAEE